MDQRYARLLAEGEDTERFPRSPATTAADLERLAASIERAIAQQTGGRIRNLQVMVTTQEILLFGICSTYHLKQLAQHAAMPFAGQNLLINLIEVR